MSPTTGIKTRLEYDDLAAVPHDHQRYELMDGRLYVTPAPSPLHQRTSNRLQDQLKAHFHPRGREVFNAPIDVILSRHDVVQPDLVVVDRAGQISGRGIEGAPLLTVEIVSPFSGDMDREIKPGRFAQFGIQHHWVVDPQARTIECYRLRGDRYELVLQLGETDRAPHPDWPDLVIDAPAIWTTRLQP
jgi:Uma2 family endonuclease